MDDVKGCPAPLYTKSAEPEVIGNVMRVDFGSDDGDLGPGVFVTIRVPDEPRWRAGTVLIQYVEVSK